MLTYENVVEKAFEALPEFREETINLLQKNILYPDSGVYIIFDYAFVPVLLRAFQKKDVDLLHRMFDFMEEMVKSQDKEVGSVCDFSILEAICGKVPEEDLYRYMRTETRKDLDFMRFSIGYLD